MSDRNKSRSRKNLDSKYFEIDPRTLGIPELVLAISAMQRNIGNLDGYIDCLRNQHRKDIEFDTGTKHYKDRLIQTAETYYQELGQRFDNLGIK